MSRVSAKSSRSHTTSKKFRINREALIVTGSAALVICFTLLLAGLGRAAMPGTNNGNHFTVSPTPMPAEAVTSDQVVSLKDVPVPVPMAAVIPVVDPVNQPMPIPGPGTNLNLQPLGTEIVKSQNALVALGKALFWDMQVGSDGVQACATCHFNAGADIRTTNQINPGQGSEDFKPNLSTATCTATAAAVNPVPAPGIIAGDSTFGNSSVPYTAFDARFPTPPGPALTNPPAPPGIALCTTLSTPSGGPQPQPCNVPGHDKDGLQAGQSIFGPNSTLVGADFPLNDWGTPTKLVPRGFGLFVIPFLDEFNDATQDTNDTVVSQGIRLNQFTGVSGTDVDLGTPLCDVVNTTTPGQLNLSGVVRRSEPRNAPTMINAVFNFDNLWDGKASFIFNGVDPFGFRNRVGTVRENINGTLTPVFLRVTNSSLASIGAAVITSNTNMSYAGRTGPDVGKKMVALRPLAKQAVDPHDSVLGALAQGRKTGLNVATYADMIRAAFQDQWWNSNTAVTVGTKTYSQMEFNFAMFFGLATQAYQATLVSDDTPFDRFEGALHPQRQNNGMPIPPDINALTPRQQLGLTLFNDTAVNIGTHCADCHVPPVTTSHTVLDNQPDAQGVPNLATGEAIEFMNMGDDLAEANYDHGFYNIGIRRTTDDPGRKGKGGSVNPLNGQKFPFSLVELVALRDSHACDATAAANNIPHVGCLPPDVARFIPNIPILPRLVVHGAFKVPNLRNVKFTGPYFHAGDSATLRQVVEFYTRGGNFPNTNLHDKTVDVDGIAALDVSTDPLAEERIHALVDFLAEGLKDPRVAYERAPFDHPEICVPNGAPTGEPVAFSGCGGKLDTSQDVFLEIPAVGRKGRAKELPTFLNLDPQQSDTSVAASTGHGDGGGGGDNQGMGPGGYPLTPSTVGPANAVPSVASTAAVKGKDWNSNVPAQFAEGGYIQAATLNNTNPNSGGTITINGTTMIVPDNSIVQFPANTLTWAQLFNQLLSSPIYDSALPQATQQQAPAITAGTTGLALLDNPARTPGLSPYTPFNAIVIGNIDVANSTGNGVGAYIVGLILPISQDMGNAGQGFITYIDYVKGRFEVGGTMGVPGTGQVVEINDPLGRYGYAHSPDPRWSVDPDNPTITAANGYPMGIAKVAPPAIDPDRPLYNRPTNPVNILDPNHDPFLQIGAPLEVFAMPAKTTTNAPGDTSPDPWRQAPLMLGDYVIYSGVLYKNDPLAPINPAIAWNQQTYISANTVQATQLMIYTAPGTSDTVGPAYVQQARGVVGTGPAPVGGPPFLQVPADPTLGIVGGTIPLADPKLSIRVVGFVTDTSQLVDIFAVDYDPTSGKATNRLLGFALPDPGIAGPLPGSPPRGAAGRFIFNVAKTDFQPTTRLYLAQSEHGQVQVPNQTGNIVPSEGGLISGQYYAPMFNFQFPDPVPGFPITPNNFDGQLFLSQGEGGGNGLSTGPLTPFPPCLKFSTTSPLPCP